MLAVTQQRITHILVMKRIFIAGDAKLNNCRGYKEPEILLQRFDI